MEIVPMIVEKTTKPIWHQLRYLIYYGKNIDNLETQIGSLNNVKSGINSRVVAAENNGDVIRLYVKDWIDEATKIAEDSEKLYRNENGNQRCSFGSCPNLLLRYKVSRKATKKKEVVDQLISRGNSFDTVFDPAPPPPIRRMYPADAKDFESRKSITDEIMEAIKDDKCNVIGVHGMGGIGKTTLVKEVAKIAEDYKLFQVITPVVAVSQTLDIKKIQNEIAARLQMKLDEAENVETRAVHLRGRIMKEGSILVILDDLWDELKLEDIGIPCSSDHKGCKILLTTRNQHVCTNMGSQIDFPVDVLTEGEAWSLFKEKAGDDTVGSSNIRDIAIEVANECKGLPLAIVLVAGALKNKNQIVWKDTLHRLQNPSPESIAKMSPKLHESLKLSYDFLGNDEEVKSCLLLCSLAPEDSNISVSELVRWGMGLRLFNNVGKWEDVRNRVRASIDKLKTQSLLLDGTSEEYVSTSEEYVRMHDMVRDFAISIASESKRGIWARIDFGISECPNGNDTTIALLNKFHQLPAQIGGGPKLNLLLLQRDFDRTVISEVFFKGMTELRVLSMVRMTIPTEPSLFQSLEKLQTLCLQRCNIADLTCITELKVLEILRFYGCDIIELPREIGQLTKLRILDLSYCTDLERIPAGVLSRLSQLEGLYLVRCSFNKWGEKDSASLDELKDLSNLSDLHMHLDNAEHFPQDIQLPRLSEFQFYLGAKYYYNVEYLPKSLVVSEYDDKRIASHQGVKMLLNMAEYLILNKMKDVECFLSDIKREGFSKLKILEVDSDSTVEYLANTTKEGDKIFPVLETLKLLAMSNLKEICHGQLPVPAGSFCELRQLILYELESLEDLWVLGNNASLPNLIKVDVYNCPKLKKLITICSQNIANGFGQQLQEISIEDCENLEEIFTYDVGVEEDEIMLPKLTILELRWLPNLATFCSKRSRVSLQQPLFPEKIVFPKLKNLKVSGNFEHIWSPRVEIHLGKNLRFIRVLTISGCQKLKKAISCNLAKSLHALEELTVENCELVEEVVEEVGESVHGEEISFPHLRKVKIYYCGGLRHLCSHSQAKLYFNQLKELYISKCHMMKEILLQESAEEEDRSSFLLFPQLDSLRLGDMPELTCLYHGHYSSLEFPSLKQLRIENCPKMETLGLDDDVMAHSLFNEKVLFPTLATLNLDGLKWLKEIWCKQIPAKSFSQLSYLSVSNCDCLRNLLTPSIVKALSSLESISIESCQRLEAILVDVNDEEEQRLVQVSEIEDKVIMFPHVHKLSLNSLPNLRSFYSGSLMLQFPSLKTFYLGDCPQMQTFSSELVFSPKPNYSRYKSNYRRFYRSTLNIKNIKSTKDFWKGDLNSSVQHLFQEKRRIEEEEKEKEEEEEKKKTSPPGDLDKGKGHM